MVIADRRNFFIQLLPKGNLTNHPSAILRGKTNRTNILWFSIELLDCVIILTRCILNDILSISNENLSNIMSTWRISDDKL